jgi:diguanylate cyclase (GGDEF)-like protein/PAS domain S-box-containing protein
VRVRKTGNKSETSDGSQEIDGTHLSAPFGTLFEKNPIAMWIFEAATLNFVAVNDATCALYGFSREQLLTMNILDLYVEEERAQAYQEIINSAGVLNPDHRSLKVKADGARIRVLRFARPTIYGGKECIVVWNIDITEREQAANDLKGTQIFLDAIVESIPSMVFVKDALDGRFVLLNKAGEELLGVSRFDLIGKSDFDLFDAEEAERFRKADQAVVISGKLVNIENEPLSTPGGQRSLRTQKVAVPDIDGKPRYLLGISEDVTEKLRIEERSRHLALHDVLTDLPNRLQFQNMLDRAMAAVRSQKRDFALLLLDLDRFKAVNDQLGHHAGDELLRQVAERMTQSLSKEDSIARLGGDEFGVIHRGRVTPESAASLADSLIAAVSQPFTIDGRHVTVGCSVGIALRSRHGGTTDALMKRADLALYAAKSTGKGDFAWFEFEMEEKADRHRLLREELGTALAKNELFLEYQPIVNTQSGAVETFEALLRWRHPTRGLISPAEFIPVAEASGLIESIGRWVLQQACDEAVRWPASIRVAVNLSPRQFNGFTLASDIIGALDKSGLSAHRLELEITESIFLTDSQENIRILLHLKQMGIRIALDDFGTGYSSLAYLRRFPFDKLKIDRSFVTDLTSSPENLAIVRAIIGLGKSFGALVTAEGVETEDQYVCLSNEGCDQAQGYWLGRSMSGSLAREHLKGSVPEIGTSTHLVRSSTIR